MEKNSQVTDAVTYTELAIETDVLKPMVVEITLTEELLLLVIVLVGNKLIFSLVDTPTGKLPVLKIGSLDCGRVTNEFRREDAVMPAAKEGIKNTF